MKRNLPALLVISDHLPIPAKPKTYKPALSLLKTLSRQWSVYFYHTDLFGTERTYRSNVSQPGIQMFPFLPESDQKRDLQSLKEFLSSHNINLVLFLGYAAAQAYLREIRLFYRHKPIACLFFDSKEIKQDLKAGKMEVMERIRRWRTLEELHNLSDQVFVNDGESSGSGKRLNQALKGLVKKAASKAAASADRTSVIFIADGPRHMVQRSFQVLRHNTPFVKEWIRVGKGNVNDVNNALRAARGDFIALVRSNSLAPPGWLEGLLRCFANPSVGAVRPFGDGKKDYPQRLWTRHSLSKVQKDIAFLSAARSLNHGNEEKKSPHLNNSCWVLRRQAVEKVGLLDRRFQWGNVAYWDYSLRLRQSGFKLANADNIVVPSTAVNEHENNVQREILAEKWVDGGLKILAELDGDGKDKG